MDDFYRKSAERIAAHLDASRDVALLAEGDPLFYSATCTCIRGSPSGSMRSSCPWGDLGQRGVGGALHSRWCRATGAHDPARTLPPAELTRRLADSDAAVILKLGRSYPAVRQALSDAGRLDDAFYVERASSTAQRVLPADEVDPAAVPYFSLTMVPGERMRRAEQPGPTAGSVTVVGLGPGDAQWMTPQSRRELAAATDLIGCWTVPGPRGEQHRTAPASQRQHRRARTGPARMRIGVPGPVGRRGVLRDPGVFAMATAVLGKPSVARRRGPG